MADDAVCIFLVTVSHLFTRSHPTPPPLLLSRRRSLPSSGFFASHPPPVFGSLARSLDALLLQFEPVRAREAGVSTRV